MPKRLQRQQFACPDVCRGSPRHSHSMLSRLHKHTAPVQTDLPVAALTAIRPAATCPRDGAIIFRDLVGRYSRFVLPTIKAGLGSPLLAMVLK